MSDELDELRERIERIEAVTDVIEFRGVEDPAGREVAIPLEPVRDAIGYVPRMARVTNNETGESEYRPVDVSGSLIYLKFDHFSTNTLEFGGTVEVSSTPGSDGSSYQYDVSALDSLSDPVVTFTETIATEWDNQSASSISSAAGGLLDPIPWTLLAALVGLGGLALLANRVFESERLVLGVVGAGAIIAPLVTTTIASPFSTVLLIFEPIGEGLGEVANLAGLVAIGIGGWYVWSNYM